MVEQGTALIRQLLYPMDGMVYPLVEQNGKRSFGPPQEWNGPAPKGCKVFTCKLPRYLLEDELVPTFAQCGKIYEIQLLMDLTGAKANRGYAFITYTNRSEAFQAVKDLNGYEIRRGCNIRVVKSVDNCRLYVGSIPTTKTKEEVYEELMKQVPEIVDVDLYQDYFDRRLNRGFAFVEFTSHLAAVLAKRDFVLGRVRLWDNEAKLNVNWAEPEPDIDDDYMKSVKVLFARNFLHSTTPETIKSAFENAISNKIETITKSTSYAFIYFHERDHAELAMKKLQCTEIDGCNIEIQWAKRRDSAKKDKKKYVNYPIKYQSIGSAYGNYTYAPAVLNSVCRRYMWISPYYTYLKYMNVYGTEVWVGQVMLPYVGFPYLDVPSCIGPMVSIECCSMQQAQVAAAEEALRVIGMMRADLIQRSMPTPM